MRFQSAGYKTSSRTVPPLQLALSSERTTGIPEPAALHIAAQLAPRESGRNSASGESRRYRSPAARAHAAGSSRDEMNLAEFPLAVLSTRVNPGLKTLEFSDTHRAPTGELVERKWIITGADKFGLPTSTDDDVVLGLLRLSMSEGFRERKVYFTRYELLKTLRWSTEGRSYKRLIRSLDRLSGVRIRSTNSFYDNSSKAYQTCNFGLIDAYEINDERGTRPITEDEQPRSFFIWSEALFDSFKAGYIKKLDLDLYFSLSSAVSRRLYRYLDKHFYYKGTIERTLLPFAFEKLGLSRTYKYVSSVRQQLEPALEELIRAGFLAHYEISGRGGASTIRFLAGAGGTQCPPDSGLPISVEPPAPAADDQPRINPAPPGPPQPAQAVEDPLAELSKRGLARFQAEKLLAAISPGLRPRIKPLLAYYDHLVAQNDYKVSKNRIGFLYRALERLEEFQIPEEFGGLQDGGSSSPRRRPELRVFGAKDAKNSGPGAELSARKQQQYNEFLNSELAGFLAGLNDDETRELYSGVETKMSCLRSVLTVEKFREAIEGCVRQEIQRRLKLPDLERWSARQP